MVRSASQSLLSPISFPPVRCRRQAGLGRALPRASSRRRRGKRQERHGGALRSSSVVFALVKGFDLGRFPQTPLGNSCLQSLSLLVDAAGRQGLGVALPRASSRRGRGKRRSAGRGVWGNFPSLRNLDPRRMMKSTYDAKPLSVAPVSNLLPSCKMPPAGKVRGGAAAGVKQEG